LGSKKFARGQHTQANIGNEIFFTFYRNQSIAMFGGERVQWFEQLGILVGAVILDQECAHFSVVRPLRTYGMQGIVNGLANVAGDDTKGVW
jgi:hypothetical protein